MKVNLIGKVIGASLLVAGVSAIVWTGSQTINNAKTFITGANTKLEAYKANEEKLIAGIEAKNTQIDSLKAQIVELELNAEENASKIAELESQIEILEQEKIDLEEQLNNAGTNNESLLAEIERLEGEINKANEEVAGLQIELDKVNLGAYEPTSSDEIDRLLAHGTDEQAPETITYEYDMTGGGVGWTHSNEYVNITDSGYNKGKTLQIKNKTEDTIKVTLHQRNTGAVLNTITMEAGAFQSDISVYDSDGIYGIKIYDSRDNLLVEGTRR